MDQHSDYTPAEEPRCAECHQWDMRRTHPYRPEHKAKCSKATVHDLRYWYNSIREDITSWSKWRMEALESVKRWEAKYRTVKHENNQLRKKLPKP